MLAPAVSKLTTTMQRQTTREWAKRGTVQMGEFRHFKGNQEANCMHGPSPLFARNIFDTSSFSPPRAFLRASTQLSIPFSYAAMANPWHELYQSVSLTSGCSSVKRPKNDRIIKIWIWRTECVSSWYGKGCNGLL